MKKVFITGATGFIGNAVARFCLAQGSETHVLVRSPESKQHFPPRIKVHFTDGSLDNLQGVLGRIRPDTVFHIASLFLGNHQPMQAAPLVASNVLFGTQLLEAMVQTGCTRLINTGTSWQHFATQDYRPVNLYAATKQAFEDIICYYHQAFGLSCITLKLFDTFGPGDTRPKLLNILTEAAKTGSVLAMSPGEQIIDICYIDDIVTAYLQAAHLLEKSREPVLHDYFVSGERLPLRRLVEVVGATLGRKINVRFGDRPYREREVMHPVMPGERLLPGWQPRYSLSDGIRLMAGASAQEEIVESRSNCISDAHTPRSSISLRNTGFSA